MKKDGNRHGRTALPLLPVSLAECSDLELDAITRANDELIERCWHNGEKLTEEEGEWIDEMHELFSDKAMLKEVGAFLKKKILPK